MTKIINANNEQLKIFIKITTHRGIFTVRAIDTMYELIEVNGDDKIPKKGA